MRPGERVVIGVAGTIGSGKTQASTMLKNLGAYYISADEVGWEVLPVISKALKERFGSAILSGTGIDKKKLQRLVFSKQEHLNFLNRLSHPLLIEKIMKRIEEIQSGVVVIDAALLFDWPGLYEIVDYPVLVRCDDKTKEERAVRAGMDRQLFRKILASQRPEEELVKQARYTIDNNGSVETLQAHCRTIYEEIQHDC